MSHHWDEFSKSLAEQVPRRESLRRLGFVFAGAVLSPLGLGTALARGPDPCKTFCNRCPGTQKSRCLAACNACDKDISRLAGSCGSYVCCGAGLTSCGSYCADLANDTGNCGACGNYCDDAGPNEFGACVDGTCVYSCYGSTERCGDGICHDLSWDSGNCGACGNACGESTPYCSSGECTECPYGYVKCGDTCVDIGFDSANCGACGYACEWDQYCSYGSCYYPDYGYGGGWDWNYGWY